MAKVRLPRIQPDIIDGWWILTFPNGQVVRIKEKENKTQEQKEK